MQVDYSTYKDQDFVCKKCSWQGKGAQLLHGDFSEEHVIGELECPKCYEVIAFWQAPIETPEEHKNRTKKHD